MGSDEYQLFYGVRVFFCFEKMMRCPLGGIVLQGVKQKLEERVKVVALGKLTNFSVLPMFQIIMKAFCC
ncbi:hypothetical protein [Bartonella mastomydis]|uniref:hypothetical protein n=1 Tax=Bartonella mastomydis TaxID=1820002 RepID=UPI0011161CBE|nr:hypothetical protein [Bartonella mastomydis]